MENFDDFLGRIRKAFGVLEEGRAFIAQARAKTEEAGQVLAQVADGANDDRPHAAVSKMEASLDALDRADAHSVGGREEFTEYVELIGGALAGAAPPSPPPLAPPRRPGWRSSRANPDAIAAVRRAGWPKNSEGRTSARAHLYDGDGNQVTPKTYQAYKKGEQPYRPELKLAFNDQDMTTTWHAEGEIAKDIRDSGVREASVYLNIKRCGEGTMNREPNPKGCSENFRHIVPKDVVVYVHVIPENGRRSQFRIVGTGEGIK